MKEKMRPILTPTYYKEFQCIGSACEDTCCAGWKVTVDKKTFQNYRETNHPVMKELLKKNVTRNRSNSSTHDYARIRMNDKGACTLLDDQGLCKVHSFLGAEMLSNTCAIYPRMLNKVDQNVEKSLSLSCPEAARHALLNPAGIDFIEEEEPANTLGFMNKEFQTEPNNPFFWDLRIFTIQVLQNRCQSIENRLILLGLFFQKIDSLPKQEWTEQLPKIMENYIEQLKNDEFSQSIKEMSSNLSFQMNMGKSLIEYRLKDGLSSERYLECLKEMIEGLSLDQEKSIEETIEKYKIAHDTYYATFMTENDYILENYLVNYVFKNLFPYDQQNLFDSYVILIINFALIRMHLVGMAQTHKGLSFDLVLKLIQSYSKTIDHNESYLVNVIGSLKESGYSTMAHMATLIKN